ncbi:hypothetical protein HYX16_06300 [Candidatus Woesearchaeota archaeon]|nr:hypothetical protein [Candidatus Woesearchaeota archaeon]
MLEDAQLVVCRKCRKKVHPSELKRESPNSSSMVCNSCLGRMKEVSSTIEELKSNISNSSEEKKRYYCEECGFKFTRTGRLINNTCPYCSKESVKVVEINLIKEIKDNSFE